MNIADPTGSPRRPEAATPNRAQKRSRCYFRCDRYFTVGHEWYFATREGSDVGPFISRDEAELVLAKYVARQCIASPGSVYRIFSGHGREATSFEAQVLEFVGSWQQIQMRTENSAYVWALQRLERLRKDPEAFDHPKGRERVLEQLIREMA